MIPAPCEGACGVDFGYLGFAVPKKLEIALLRIPELWHHPGSSIESQVFDSGLDALPPSCLGVS